MEEDLVVKRSDEIVMYLTINNIYTKVSLQV